MSRWSRGIQWFKSKVRVVDRAVVRVGRVAMLVPVDAAAGLVGLAEVPVASVAAPVAGSGVATTAAGNAAAAGAGNGTTAV